MARKPKSNAVINPNLGLYFDRPKLALSPEMLSDGLNFRIKEGTISNLNLGWTPFEGITLNGPVTLIHSFRIPSNAEILVLASLTDMYQYNAGPKTVSYITPIYATGTAAASGTAVTGTGTLWVANANAGDEISFGSATERDPDADWFTILTVDTDTGITLTATAGIVVDGPYTIRKLFNGSITDVWSYDVFTKVPTTSENHFYATNGVDPVIRWNGTDDQVELMTSLGFTCSNLRVYANMMIYGKLVQSGTALVTDIINSDVGDPSNVSSGLSEQFKVHSGTDSIIEMKPLGDNFVIYSKNHTTILQFVGGDLIFVFRSISNNIGSISRAIADFGDYHEFVGTDTQYRFNGASLIRVNEHVWRELVRQQDPGRVKFSFSFFDNENGDLLWVVPSTSDPGIDDTGIETPPSRCAVEHYLEEVPVKQFIHQPYSLRSFPFTAIGYYSRQDGITWDQLTQQWAELNFKWNDQFFLTAFPLILVGGIDGQIFILNSSQNADNTALTSYVRFGRKAIVDGRVRGLISRIYPFVQSFSTPINVSLLTYDHASANTPAAVTTIAFDQSLPEGGHFVTPYRRGRFIEVQFGTSELSTPWVLEGYDIDIRSGGKR